MNPRVYQWYFEVLWSEAVGLCKKLNSIYNIIIITCKCVPSKQFSAQAAQIYKLLNQNSRMDLRLEVCPLFFFLCDTFSPDVLAAKC